MYRIRLYIVPEQDELSASSTNIFNNDNAIKRIKHNEEPEESVDDPEEHHYESLRHPWWPKPKKPHVTVTHRTHVGRVNVMFGKRYDERVITKVRQKTLTSNTLIDFYYKTCFNFT